MWNMILSIWAAELQQYVRNAGFLNLIWQKSFMYRIPIFQKLKMESENLRCIYVEIFRDYRNQLRVFDRRQKGNKRCKATVGKSNCRIV